MANDIIWSICVQTIPLDSIPIFALHCDCHVSTAKTDRSIFVIATTQRNSNNREEEKIKNQATSNFS